MDTSRRVASAAFLLVASIHAVVAAAATISRVSLSSAGTPANAYNYLADTSENGRFYAFTSDASNLVPSDNNGVEDVFVRDRETGETTRVSVSTNGTQGNSDSLEPAISADGRFVVFLTFASNLVPNDTNGEGDVVLHDRLTGATTLVSSSSAGVQSNDFSCNPAISADGSVIAFFSDGNNLVAGDTNGVRDIFVKVRATGVTSRISVSSAGVQSDNNSFLPAVSANGRYVTYHSFGSTLVANDTNGVLDVFLRDRQAAFHTLQWQYHPESWACSSYRLWS
jgi:Tol biopolymer transport system component